MGRERAGRGKSGGEKGSLQGGVSVRAPNRVLLGQSPLLSGGEEKTALTEQ